MTIPVIHDFPVKRPDFIQSAEWQGPDSQLVLKLTYYDASGTLRGIQFSTRHLADGAKGEICLPSSNNLADLGPRYEDVLVAHTRMACLVARSGIPGSDEFLAALLEGPSAYLNTALGTVKVTAVTPIDDATVRLTYRQGTGPTLNVDIDYANLNDYVFVPETQLFVVAGAVKKEYSTYVHDYPSTLLTQVQRDNVTAYVMTLEPWI